MKHQLLFAVAQFIIDEFTAHKTLIVFIIVGMVAGLIAQLVLPGRGFGLVATAAIGVAGCYIGLLFIDKYLTFIENPVLKELSGAIIGAALISLAINFIRGKEPANTK